MTDLQLRRSARLRALSQNGFTHDRQGHLKRLAQEDPESQPRPKRQRTSHPDPLVNWVLNQTWPNTAENMEPPTTYINLNGRLYPRPIRKLDTLRRKQSESSLTGSSDSKKREGKSAAYRDTRYTALLAAKGSFLENHRSGPSKESLQEAKKLLTQPQKLPHKTLFDDDVFDATCRSVQDRNEARIIRSITPYIVPSVEDFAIMGATELHCLIENVNEAWASSIAIEGPRPQPDYSVGFRRTAFTEQQLSKLDPLIGTVYDTSFFAATYQMYFPFFTAEIKGGAAALDIADRQNAHSMTIAVRGVVELFKAVGREQALNREILAFAISHDHSSVRLYGHYPVIEGDKVTFYRHSFKRFDFTSEEGIDKWTAYKFTKNIYENWMPVHLKRLCDAIDALPTGLDFQIPDQVPEVSSETTGLSFHFNDLVSDEQGNGQLPTPEISTSPDQSAKKQKKN